PHGAVSPSSLLEAHHQRIQRKAEYRRKESRGNDSRSSNQERDYSCRIPKGRDYDFRYRWRCCVCETGRRPLDRLHDTLEAGRTVEDTFGREAKPGMTVRPIAEAIDPRFKRLRRQPGLDLLRALAILVVVIYHNGIFGFALPHEIDRFGWVGVDLFFVL